jgi:hypothetical protein
MHSTEGSRDPALVGTLGGVLVFASDTPSAEPNAAFCIGLAGETGAFKCLTPSTSSPARSGVFLCRGARHKHGGAWLASHVDMRAGALGLYAASRCLRRRKAGIVSGSSRWRTDRRRAVAIATLPARHAILDVIGCFLTNRCQIEKLLFYGYVFGRFGKLPIFGCFVPKIISPIHVASRLQQLPEGAGGHSTTG